MAENLSGHFQRKNRIALFIALCGFLLAGCSEKKEDQARAPTGQIIAHVGNDDITRQELENEFRWADIPAEKWEDGATVKRILDEVVVRKYLKQQALAAHLDQLPTVILDIQRSREQMLANDLVQRNALAKIASVRPRDIYKYVDSHPAKFTKRAFLTVDQINLSLGAYTQSVIDATKDLNSIEAVEQKLMEMGVVHTRSVGVLNSGDLPEDLFKALQAKKNPHDVFFVRAGSNGVFFEVKSEEASPVEGQAAVRLAQQLVRAEILKKEIGDAAIAAKAQVKFESKYATIMGTSEPKAETGKKVEPEK
jgi:EpsD family peptidyl-prolyl cis-trans isomerase